MYQGSGSTREISKTKITGVLKEKVGAFRRGKMKGWGGRPEVTARVLYLVALEMNGRTPVPQESKVGGQPDLPYTKPLYYT